MKQRVKLTLQKLDERLKLKCFRRMFHEISANILRTSLKTQSFWTNILLMLAEKYLLITLPERSENVVNPGDILFETHKHANCTKLLI